MTEPMMTTAPRITCGLIEKGRKSAVSNIGLIKVVEGEGALKTRRAALPVGYGSSHQYFAPKTGLPDNERVTLPVQNQKTKAFFLNHRIELILDLELFRDSNHARAFREYQYLPLVSNERGVLYGCVTQSGNQKRFTDQFVLT